MDRVGGQEEDEEDRSSSTSIVKINIYERESPLLSPSPTLISPAGKKISFHCPGELGETSGETSAANRAATKNSIPTRISSATLDRALPDINASNVPRLSRHLKGKAEK